jgi:hypothetical protein
LPHKEPYFHSGGIEGVSLIRAAKLFTANEALILGVAGHPAADAAPPIHSPVMTLKSSLAVMILRTQ